MIVNKKLSKLQIPEKGKIDIVYIWCNSGNKNFVRDREEFAKKYKINNYWSETKDHSEISYSIKSVRKNMKWIRNIFICSPKNHKIKNFDEKKYGVKYISNEKILGIENCPNFNSHSLEIYTYKIKGLSDFFIQFNDDFFINNKVYLEDFFNFETKKIKYFYENFLFLGKPLSFTTQKIINKIVGEKYYFWPAHMPRMFNKNDIEKIVKKYDDIVLNTKETKFRSKYDFQLVHFYGYYLLSSNSGEFIFLDNIINTNTFLFKLKILFFKFFSENFFNVIKQIFLQIFYKKKLYKNKFFSNKKNYALINIGNDYKKNKENINLVIKNKVKFVCLNDLYNTNNKKLKNKILKENYQYFYNNLI